MPTTSPSLQRARGPATLRTATPLFLAGSDNTASLCCVFKERERALVQPTRAAHWQRLQGQKQQQQQQQQLLLEVHRRKQMLLQQEQECWHRRQASQAAVNRTPSTSQRSSQQGRAWQRQRWRRGAWDETR